MNTSTDHFLAELEPVRRQLQSWRRQRHPRERIPSSLWKAMARLARVHGISRVCQALRIEYHALKRRVGELTDPPAPAPQQPFVELNLPPFSTAQSCVVELQDRSGAKMTLHLPPSRTADALALAQSFWSRSR